MSGSELVSLVLLGFGTVVIAWCSLALLLLPSPHDQLHYVSLMVTLAVPAIGLAVLIKEGLTLSGLKTVLIALLFLFTGPVLTHATGRAIRIREEGGWRPPIENEEAES